MSEHGAAPLCWSVAHVGPIGLSASDCAIGYLLMAGPDEKDPNTLGQPPVHLEGYGSDSLEGTRIGVVPEWFEFADEAVVRTCKKALDRLKDAGAEIVETDIPSLEMVRPAHLVIIVSEMASAQLQYWRRHRNDYAADTRMNLALARRLHAYDYIQAQRTRLEICSDFARAFEKIDLLATPATGCTAPPIRKDALGNGESDLVTTERIMRFAPAANLTGLPAISFPVGYDDDGMPVGLQLMARAYEEHLLLRAARLAEDIFERRRPKVYRSLLARP
ncbi:MAG: hypothetical protein D6806_04460 [Deltaproteobacteria bacterium]|nr:MAG: hypothetical protein D6806_04460 [Deltaproteobacteria bacterium]